MTAFLRRSFDSLAERVAASRRSLDEAELLREGHWALGEDARLREDLRFRPTPWGRWIAAGAYLVNDTVFARLQAGPGERLRLDAIFSELDQEVGRRCVLCSADPRLVFDEDAVRLSARELTGEPLVEAAPAELEKYVSHLPVHTLRATAASLPQGEWGRRAQEEVIETLGWLRVALPGRKLNRKMFVARIEGHSMDDGRSGLVNGGYAVFELWPVGSRQGKDVLVRGRFSDPETGNYAVKRYLADQRDAEGQHHQIKLVSLNPDKARYPDIELSVEAEDDLAVVAKVEHALAPGEFARRPKPRRRPGRRDLSSEQAVAEISAKLAASTERFFEAAARPDGPDTEPDRESWSSGLVCLSAEAGGPQVEVGPLVGLWSFVRLLRLEGSNWSTTIPASNPRQRAVRVRVPAGSGPWRWRAVDFEEDTDADLGILKVAGLAPDRAHAFRVDAADIGRPVASTALSPGQHYRVLMSEAFFTGLGCHPPAVAAGEGWRIWELEVPLDGPVADEGALREAGLTVGEPAARLDWAVVAPVAWRTTARGDAYPCFLSAAPPVVAVSGPMGDFAGAATLFLHGPGGTSTLELPAAARQLVRLGDLAAGRYSLLALHERTRVSGDRLPFEVLREEPPPPPTSCGLALGSDVVGPRPGASEVVPARDLGALDVASVALEAPPGWPVQVFWREGREELLGSLEADEAGHVNLVGALDRARKRWGRRLGDLVFDLGELGAIILPHERHPEPETVREQVLALVRERGEAAERLAGAFLDLRPILFEPLCTALGYELDSIEASEPPQHAAVFRLLHAERRGDAIERQPVRLLLLVEDLREPLPTALLTWTDVACGAIRDVLVSDGLRWGTHRRGSRLAPLAWDLRTVAADPVAFLSFLHAAAEGV